MSTAADDPTMSRELRAQRLFVRGLLTIVFIALLLRLVGFLVVFVNTNVQMDFSAFYTAGKAVAADLSPYVNNVDRDPPIWDGISPFVHSRFLYPPLAARPFQLLAMIPFAVAKLIWMLLSVIALSAALVVALRTVRLAETPENLLVIGIVATAAYPTLTLFERGQIDGFILLLIMAALGLIVGRRSCLAAGGLLSLATLMKLNCVFMLPFLLLRRRWRAALGYVAGGIVLLGLSLAIDGPAAVSDYAFEQLPRIAEHGEGGTPEMALPLESFSRALGTGLPAGYTRYDGEMYRRATFRYVLNASLAQTAVGESIRSAASRVGVTMSPSGTALLCMTLCVALVYGWLRRYGPPGGADDPTGELIYWQLVMTLILLCGPVTWAMTVVWMLPIAVILLQEMRRLRTTGDAWALLVCAVGFILAVAPDGYGSFMLSPLRRETWDQKYVVAEILCAVGLLWLWRQRAMRAKRDATNGGTPEPEVTETPA